MCGTISDLVYSRSVPLWFACAILYSTVCFLLSCIINFDYSLHESEFVIQVYIHVTVSTLYNVIIRMYLQLCKMTCTLNAQTITTSAAVCI